LIFSGVVAGQTVDGDVVNAATGAPIVGAHVFTNVGTAGQPPIVTTDAAGHFRLPVPALTQFSVQVVQAGFLREAVQYKRGQAAALRTALTPEAVISGRIEDEDGYPVEHAQVAAVRYRIVNGERKLWALAWAQTDDLGQYRLINLVAGRYWVRASSGDAGNWDRRYVAEYFPGTLQPDDTNRVEIEAGQEHGGVDIRLTKYEGVTVSGRVEMPAGAAASPRMFNVRVQTELAGLPDIFFGLAQRDGSFIIRHVPPGDYILRTTSGNYPPKAGDLLGEQKLQVAEADVTSIVLATHEVQAVDLAGTVVTDSGGNPPPMRIGLRAMSGPGVSVRSNEDGSFVLKDLLPGHYDMQVMQDLRVVNGTVEPSSIHGFPVSARLGEKEVLQNGFDVDGPPAGSLRITLSTRLIPISGKLLDASGSPASEALLGLISKGQAVDQGVAIADADGSFHFAVWQPGDYRIIPLRYSGDVGDAEYLEKHENDFPPFKAVDGTNPPLMLRLPAQQAR
jgi:hypothetical protein